MMTYFYSTKPSIMKPFMACLFFLHMTLLKQKENISLQTLIPFRITS